MQRDLLQSPDDHGGIASVGSASDGTIFKRLQSVSTVNDKLFSTLVTVQPYPQKPWSLFLPWQKYQISRPTITIKTPAEMMPTSNAVTSTFDWDSPLPMNTAGNSGRKYSLFLRSFIISLYMNSLKQ